jgi:hypothetical protein
MQLFQRFVTVHIRKSDNLNKFIRPWTRCSHRLLHETLIFPIPIMRLLQPSLQIKVYNVGAQVEREFRVIKVMDSDTCLHLADLRCNH